MTKQASLFGGLYSCGPSPTQFHFVILSVFTHRVIRELEAQLEYEREKREKLEAQMDKLRAQIHTLTLQLEDERGRHLTAVDILYTNTLSVK